MSDTNRDKLLSMMKSHLKDTKKESKPSRNRKSKQAVLQKDTPSQSEGLVVIGLENQRAGKQLASMLLQFRLKTKVAANGSDAWEMIQQEMPDCIVVDEKLAFIAGTTVCEKVRMLPDGLLVPVLLVVSSEDKTTRSQANDSGVTGLVTRPVVMVDLAKKVRAFIK